MSTLKPDFYIGISTQNPPTIISIGRTIDGMEEIEVRLDKPDEDKLTIFKGKIDDIQTGEDFFKMADKIETELETYPVNEYSSAQEPVEEVAQDVAPEQVEEVIQDVASEQVEEVIQDVAPEQVEEVIQDVAPLPSIQDPENNEFIGLASLPGIKGSGKKTKRRRNKRRKTKRRKTKRSKSNK